MQVGNRVRKIDDQRGGVSVGAEGTIVSLTPDEVFFVAFDGREYPLDGEPGEHCIPWELELIDDPAPAEVVEHAGDHACAEFPQPPVTRTLTPLFDAEQGNDEGGPPYVETLTVQSIDGTREEIPAMPILFQAGDIVIRYADTVSWLEPVPAPVDEIMCYGKVQGTISGEPGMLFVVDDRPRGSTHHVHGSRLTVIPPERVNRNIMTPAELAQQNDEPMISPPAVLTTLGDDEREQLRDAAVAGDERARGVLEGVAMSFMERAGIGVNGKDSNPKDAVGIAKAYASTIPRQVLWEVGLAMLEGSLKYGRHNYRKAGVRASVYYDACTRHMDQWWEGEDIDPDSGLSHITKAIAGLVVLRDAMLNNLWADDRPPRNINPAWMQELNARAKDLLERYPPDARKLPFTQQQHGPAGE